MQRDMKRTEILERNEQSMEKRRYDLIDIQNEKSQRSGIARKKHDEELEEKKFKHFLNQEDKKLNVQRIARAQEFERMTLNGKIEEDNNRSLRIREERTEIMTNKQLLRRQIDKDKQKILEDFEQIKQGKVDPSEVARKYGYVPKTKDEASMKSQTMNNSRQNFNTNSSQNVRANNAQSRQAYNPPATSHNQSKNPSTSQPRNNSQAANRNENTSSQGQTGMKSTAQARQEEQKRKDEERTTQVEEAKKRHNQELLSLIEQEQSKEDKRDQRLKGCSDVLERQELENKFSLERSEAQRTINQVIKRHKEELARLR